eukprot:scaffold3161_cov247-Ochromonas_danica.AAC.7
MSVDVSWGTKCIILYERRNTNLISYLAHSTVRGVPTNVPNQTSYGRDLIFLKKCSASGAEVNDEDETGIPATPTAAVPIHLLQVMPTIISTQPPTPNPTQASSIDVPTPALTQDPTQPPTTIPTADHSVSGGKGHEQYTKYMDSIVKLTSPSKKTIKVLKVALKLSLQCHGSVSD